MLLNHLQEIKIAEEVWIGSKSHILSFWDITKSINCFFCEDNLEQKKKIKILAPDKSKTEQQWILRYLHHTGVE